MGPPSVAWGSGQRQCLLDPYLLPAGSLQTWGPAAGQGSARRGGAAAGGREWSQSLVLAVGTRGALPSEAQLEDPWTSAEVGWVPVYLQSREERPGSGLGVCAGPALDAAE